MLKKLSIDSPDKSAQDIGSTVISDPWETTNPDLKRYPVPDSWKLPTEPHPLIAPAEHLGVLKLAAPRVVELSPAQLLLQDELKLAVDDEKLTAQLKEALGLLYWIEQEGCADAPQKF